MHPPFTSFRAILVGLTALLCSLLSAGCGLELSSKPPNVVVIVVDTLRADHLSQYGYTRDTSPALTDFATHSTIFTRAYSTSSWTKPSIASLFTGLMPSSHRVVGRDTVFPGELETVAERLSGAGWQTAAFSGNLLTSGETGFEQGFDQFVGHDGETLAYPDVAKILDQADAWLDTRTPDSEPFLLYLQPMNCHGPYTVPEERQAELLGRKPGREFKYQGRAMRSVVKRGELTNPSLADPLYVQSLTDQYDTAVRYCIDSVGRLLDSLRTRGLYDETLVVITADHGEELLDHGGFSHGYSLYEEVVRIQLWIKLPFQAQASTIDHPVSLLDVYPTILDVLDLEEPVGLQGFSLMPFLQGDASSAPSSLRPILLETRWETRSIASAIRIGAYKLIDIRSDYRGRKDVQLLFNLEEDPNELEDLAASHPEIVEPMKRQLARALRSEQPVEDLEKLEFDSDMLEALGYLD